jgi:colanic acid/amylovoran biosynthesis glycosyltransferase
MKMQNVLIFFTYAYPFGSDEAFIEKEIPYLAKAFDKIVIISNDCINEQTRSLPDHVSVERTSYELDKKNRILSITGLFSPVFWDELLTTLLRYKKKPTPIIIKTALLTLQKAKVFGKRLEKTISKYTEPTDNIFLYSFWTDDKAFAISKFKRLLNIKKVFSRAHRWDVYLEENKSNYLPYRKYILKNIDTIYFSTQNGADYYQNIFPELNHKMHVSYLGVARQPIIPTKQSDHSFRIVSCSYLIPIKRIHLIAEALELINNFNIEWIHFGDGSLTNEIKHLCQKKLGPKQNIKYTIYGSISNAELIQYYSLHYTDLYINVSRSEGIAVSIMEAMSFSIPCMATAVGGTPEIVNDGNGYLLSPDPSAEEIAEKITDFYYLDEVGKKRKQNSTNQMWIKKCDAGKNYKEFIEDILSLNL